MDQELQRLIDSPEFKQYQAEIQKSSEFSPFDVLRYADYEIRHSNVLAWLLRPDGSHGIGDAFIREFMHCLNESATKANLPRFPMPESFEGDNIQVEREFHHVDIALLFPRERLLVAVENKLEAAAPQHYDQVDHYQKELRKRYKHEYNVRRVLLTASRVGATEREAVHVSWFTIHEIVDSLYPDRSRPRASEAVGAFIQQYLDVVHRMVLQQATGGAHFRKLLVDHRPILAKLREDKRRGVGSMFTAIGGLEQNALGRLVDEFARDPERLRSVVDTVFKAQGFQTWMWTRTHSAYFLYFSKPGMEQTRKGLGLHWILRWMILCDRDGVLVQLQFDPPEKGREAARSRVIDFVRETLVGQSRVENAKYRMKADGAYFVVYRNRLYSYDESSTAPVSNVEEEVRRRTEEFLRGDLRAIEKYFGCLAFDPSTPPAEDVSS